MRIHLLFALVCVFFLNRPEAQITILENSRERFVFEWKINSLDTASVNSSKGRHTIPFFKEQNTTVSADPCFSFFVGVPQNGDLNVLVEPDNIVQMHLSHPVLMPNDSNQTSIEFKSNWISEPLYSKMGPFRTAHFFIRPFKYDPVTENGRVMLRGKVTINFPVSSGVKITSEVSNSSLMMKTLLLNYSIAQNWGAVKKLNKKMFQNYQISSNQKTVYFKVGDGHIGFSEGTINENGIVKIPGEKIVEIFGTAATDKVALYASFKGALPETPSEAGAIPDGINEVPLYRYDANENGIVEKGDYFLAYISGVSDWIYEGGYKYHIDPYEESRTYWITLKTTSGSTLQKFIQPAGTGKNVDYFTNRLFCKQSLRRVKKSQGGNEWVWQYLDRSARSFNCTFELPLLDSTSIGKININDNITYSGSRSVSFSNMKISDLSHTISNWQNKNVNIEFTPGTDTSYYEMFDIKFEYRSKIQVGSRVLKMNIFSEDDTGFVTYTLRGLSDQKIYLFRITADDNSISLIDTFLMGKSNTYTWSDSGGRGVRYYLCKENEFVDLPGISTPFVPQEKYLQHDLKNTTHQTDYLIIAHPDFLSECATLAAHKEKMGFKYPAVIDVNEIYRSFSGGNKDPSAIRNFIAFVQKKWDRGDELFYVVLMGNGNYNPKKYDKSITDYIPIYQKGETLKEDFYSYTETLLDGQNLLQPKIVIGRFPVNSKTEASAMVNKIIEMEDPEKADFGAWRNRTLLVADDDRQGETYDGMDHHLASEQVSSIIENSNPSMDVRKAYLFEYEKNSGGSKPGATNAILNEINNGVAYVNYFGHGDRELWADEWILRLENVGSMNNRKQYPLISSYSCSVGKFDLPGKECLSGALVKEPSGGACATISSTRESQAPQNEEIANAFYINIFDSSSISIGMAYLLAKLHCGNNQHHMYALFGDPSLQLLNRDKKIEFEITTLKDSLITTIQALQRIKIKGTIKNSDNSIATEFGNGQIPAFVKIGLFNAPDSTARKDGGEPVNVRYMLPGTPLFLGKTLVIKGSFEQLVQISKNVSFNKSGVKLTGYAWREKNPKVATGDRKGLLFIGTDTSDISNKEKVGPRISIRPLYSNVKMGSDELSFTDRITSLLPLNLQIDLYDESGIDVSSNGPDEGLTIEVPGVLSKKSLNSTFQFYEGDFREGRATYEIGTNTIKPGIYDLNIQARDLRGNISLKKIALEITSQTEIKLDHVFNFPNPFKMGQTIRFYFYPSNTTFKELPVYIYIKIYSLSGKLLRVFTDAHNGMPWDGRDQAGNILSPNVYLFQITAYKIGTQQKTTKSKIQKIVIHPPR